MNQQNSLSLAHLDRMTDSTGIIQHGIYSLPRRESGYTTDDNAWALLSQPVVNDVRSPLGRKKKVDWSPHVDRSQQSSYLVSTCAQGAVFVVNAGTRGPLAALLKDVLE